MVTWINLPQKKVSKHQKRGQKKTERINLELRTENRNLQAESKKSKAYYSRTTKVILQVYLIGTVRNQTWRV